jgi:hypothetical protein
MRKMILFGLDIPFSLVSKETETYEQYDDSSIKFSIKARTRATLNAKLIKLSVQNAFDNIAYQFSTSFFFFLVYAPYFVEMTATVT